MLELRFKCHRKHNQCSYIRLKKPQRAFKGLSTEKMLIIEEEENEEIEKMAIQKNIQTRS